MSISIDRAAAGVQMTGHDNFAQVEPNHLSAPRDGGVYAQLPADESIQVLEQGMIVKYDMAAGKVALTGNGISAMVFNEEKLYDERKQMHRDYAMKKSDFYDGVMTPLRATSLQPTLLLLALIMLAISFAPVLTASLPLVRILPPSARLSLRPSFLMASLPSSFKSFLNK